jgi:hypothetical protein
MKALKVQGQVPAGFDVQVQMLRRFSDARSMVCSRLIAGRDEEKCVGRSHVKAVSGDRDSKVIFRPVSHGSDLPLYDWIQLSFTPWELLEKINAGTLRVGRRYCRAEAPPR